MPSVRAQALKRHPAVAAALYLAMAQTTIPRSRSSMASFAKVCAEVGSFGSEPGKMSLTFLTTPFARRSPPDPPPPPVRERLRESLTVSPPRAARG